MASPDRNWYRHLVGQSSHDNIYTLIHSYLVPDWEPNHELDFVVVRKKNLPAHLKDIPQKNISKKLSKEGYCFPGNDYVLLHNYKLTQYLDAAKWAIIIEDFEDSSFIELFFEKTEESEAITPAQLKPPASEDEKALITAYKLLSEGEDKQLALQYAERGKFFLDNQVIEVNENSVEALQLIERRMLGYNIIAMVFAWNNQINKAASADAIYIHHPALWNKLAEYIESYLEMLMIKRQQDYLHHLFGDIEFRQRFLAYYEAFISLFVNDKYVLTRTSKVINIINRVRNDRRYV